MDEWNCWKYRETESLAVQRDRIPGSIERYNPGGIERYIIPRSIKRQTSGRYGETEFLAV